MNLLWNLLTVILQVVLPMVLKSKPDTMEDAARQPLLRSRLRKRIRTAWPKAGLAMLFLIFACPLGGCVFSETRTVYIPDGQPVRLRETIKNAKVWVPDKDGEAVAGVMDLEEGWYCMSLDDDSDSEAESENTASVPAITQALIE